MCRSGSAVHPHGRPRVGDGGGGVSPTDGEPSESGQGDSMGQRVHQGAL